MLKKLFIILLVLLSSFVLFADMENGHISIALGPDFSASYSVDNRTSVGAFGLDVGMEAQLGNSSHLVLLADMDVKYPCMRNFEFYDFSTKTSFVMGSDIFVGLGFNTGFGKRTSFTLGAGPYVMSLDVTENNTRFSVISFGAQAYASAKFFVTNKWFIDTTLRAGMTFYDIENISFSNWFSDDYLAGSANTFAFAGRIGCGYLF